MHKIDVAYYIFILTFVLSAKILYLVGLSWRDTFAISLPVALLVVGLGWKQWNKLTHSPEVPLSVKRLRRQYGGNRQQRRSRRL